MLTAAVETPSPRNSSRRDRALSVGVRSRPTSRSRPTATRQEAGISSDIDVAVLRGPITVTAAYFVLWYALLFGLQTRTKYRLRREYAARGEVFDRYRSADPEMLKADRAVQNTHEQMVPFLVAMWTYTFAVSPDAAAGLGGAYVVLRAIYPFLLGSRIEQVQPRRVALVTFPCYGIITWMLGGSVAKAWLGWG